MSDTMTAYEAARENAETIEVDVDLDDCLAVYQDTGAGFQFVGVEYGTRRRA